MKCPLLALSLPAAVALLAGCNSGGSAEQGLALGSVPWQDGDRALYQVVDREGAVVGRSEFTFAQEDGVWLISATDKIGQLDQVYTVRLDATTLKPLGEEKTIHTGDSDVTLSTTYAEGRLQIDAVVNGEERSAGIDVPAHALDNDQLLMTLRALQFAEGYEGRYVNVVAANAARINTTVRVVGQEEVEVPAGSFQTWRVELDFGQAKQNVWYQVDAPQHMVQYDNGNLKFVLDSPSSP
jgi:hypothetical protein